MQPVLTTAEITALEQKTVAYEESSLAQLMDRAGKAVAEFIKSFNQPVLVLVGPGNNGGDGFVAAHKLQQEGLEVRIAADKLPSQGIAYDARIHWRGDIISLKNLEIHENEIIVDGLFGTGLERPIEGSYAEVVSVVNARSNTVVSIDIPSGIHTDTAEVMGIAIQADHTVTFDFMKPGHLLLPGLGHCGIIHIASIGLMMPEKTSSSINEPSLWLDFLTKPTVYDNKYTRGHVGVIAGAMLGASRLVASSARRVGCGLLTLFAEGRPLIPEAGVIVRDLKDGIDGLKLNVITIGPGLENSDASRLLIKQVLSKRLPCVIDAGAISAFKDNPQDLISHIHAACIVTPHEGEFARLFPHISGAKHEKALKASKACDAVVLYKGADTVIANVSGSVAFSTNPALTLATGGTGDVLTGLIAGLLGQGMPPFEAACAASWIQVKAAYLFGPGLIAEDLPGLVPRVLEELFAMK